MLGVVIVLVVALLVAVAVLATQQASLREDVVQVTKDVSEMASATASLDEIMGMGMPTAEQEQVFRAVDAISMDVGFYALDGETEAYLALYREGDEHVDIAAAQKEFAAFAAEASADWTQVPGMMFDAFRDTETGEMLVNTRIEGANATTGAPAGDLEVWVAVDAETGDAYLTGEAGRELERDADFPQF
jgi:methionine aminopeptidase